MAASVAKPGMVSICATMRLRIRNIAIVAETSRQHAFVWRLIVPSSPSSSRSSGEQTDASNRGVGTRRSEDQNTYEATEDLLDLNYGSSGGKLGIN